MRKKLGRSTDLVKPTEPPAPAGALIYDRQFSSTKEIKSDVLEQLLAVLAQADAFADPADEVNYRLVLDEALVNAVTHGNRSDATKKARVRAYHNTTASPAKITFLVEDEGPGFREEDLPDPNAPENLLEESGRGVILIRSIMSDVGYWRGGATLMMSKVLRSK